MAFNPSSSPEKADEDMRKTVRRKIAWRLIPLLAPAYFLASLERANLGIASLSMNESLGLSSATFGLAAGMFFIGYFLFEVPSNLAMARFGARKWLARIAVTWGVAATLTAAVQGEVSLYVMRILLGIAEAGLFPGVVFYFMLWFPARDRAKMLSLFVLGATLANMVGPPLSGAILELWPSGLLGLEDWRALFIIEGLPSIVVGLLIFTVLVDTPDKTRWLTAEEKNWLAGEVDDRRRRVRPRRGRAECPRCSRTELVEAGFAGQKWFFADGPGQGEEELARNVELAARAREGAGPRAQLMFDAFMGWDLAHATAWCREAEQFRPTWLEEPFAPAAVAAYAQLRGLTTVPLAAGEHLYDRFDLLPFLQGACSRRCKWTPSGAAG
ncbi:MFS transporter [Saccharopolyspora sp. TS4A08]|uniref:MFS transporter n=1 Tax=Saccharopolyspora ipomoeae TaxID=3042027 RepID=A0ABT6PQA6_9PSEU|nr:MFS transporter [Saccharopolyspora sp. TS4A08]MDI2030194.1 MFS transporter [Saccharopolyspora sp. TS4A08]